jgi:hypothetical protein
VQRDFKAHHRLPELVRIARGRGIDPEHASN